MAKSNLVASEIRWASTPLITVLRPLFARFLPFREVVEKPGLEKARRKRNQGRTRPSVDTQRGKQAMMTNKGRSRPASLRERILQAQTASEVRSLLAEGTSFKAKQRTRNQWKQVAEERLQQLSEFPL